MSIKTMNPEIREKWIAALESGEYKQCQGSLKTNDGFCCLGVLCDLHAKETGKEWKLRDNINEKRMKYLENSFYLPKEVIDWATLGDTNPITSEDKYLSVLNDRGVSFNEIANLIESGL